MKVELDKLIGTEVDEEQEEVKDEDQPNEGENPEVGEKEAKESPDDVLSLLEGKKEDKGNWTTSLPKELREGIDTEKYKSLGEYIKALRNQEGEEVTESDEVWENLKKTLEISEEELDGDIGKPIFEKLKASGIKSKNAETLYAGIKEVFEKATADKLQEFRKDSYSVIEKYNLTKKENKEALSKALRTIRDENPERYDRAAKDGILLHPVFLEVCAKLAPLLKEGELGGGGEGRKNADFQMNPYGY